jgi:hypothetical protein
MIDLMNPWDAANGIQAFSFYCCPECVYRSKSEGDFQIHATFNHEQAKEFYQMLEGRISIEGQEEQEVLECEVKQEQEEQEPKPEYSGLH